MRLERINPRSNRRSVHVCGLAVGLVLFVARIVQPEGIRWPDSKLSALALMVLLMCAFLFAVVTMARNRMLDQQ
jgi:hypothetical protein